MSQLSRPSFRSVLPLVAGAALLAFTVGGCSVTEPLAQKRGGHMRVAHAVGDAKPHPGVSHAKHYPIHGIDVSKWQGDIDWQAVKRSGVKFAFIKATEGGDHVDDRFAQNWAGAKEAGVSRGAYHFVFWCRPAVEQAAWFEKHIPNDPEALPPVLDVEWNPQSRNCPGKISPELAREKMAIMLKHLERHTGKRPIIYTDITFNQEVLAGGHFEDYPFWVRSTAADPKERYDNRRWALWQYTTTGRIPGIAGNVDRNTFNGSQQQWLAFMDMPKTRRPRIDAPIDDGIDSMTALAMAPL